MDSPAYKHIKKYKIEQNNQDAMKTLRDFYKGIDKRNERSSVAIQNIRYGKWGLAYYQEDVVMFHDYASQLQISYNVLLCEGQTC